MKLYLSLLFIALAFLISATPQQTRILSQNDLNCIKAGVTNDPIFGDIYSHVSYVSPSNTISRVWKYSNLATKALINDDNDSNDNLNECVRFLFDESFSHFVSIDNIVIPMFICPTYPDYIVDGNAKTRDLSTIISLYANIVDKVYYHYDEQFFISLGISSQVEFQQSLLSKLHILTSFAKRRIEYSLPGILLSNNPELTEQDSTNSNYSYYASKIVDAYPGTAPWIDIDNQNDYIRFFAIKPNNIGLRLIAAVGLASTVLGNNDYLNFIDDILFNYAGNDNYYWNNVTYETGLLNLLIQDSGVYGEGLYYREYCYNILMSYFTFRFRYDGENLYEKNLIKKDLKAVNSMMYPSYYFLPYDDVADIYNVTSHYGSLGYLQFGGDMDLKDIISSNINHKYRLGMRNFMNEIYWGAFIIQSYNGVTVNPSVTHNSFNYQLLFNSEVTVLKEKLTDLNDFGNHTSLYINHEKSRSTWYHEDADQSSFTLNYNSSDLLLDPGYSWTRSNSTENSYRYRLWMSSPLAHNLIITTDDAESLFSMESDYLNNTTDLLKNYIDNNDIDQNVLRPIALSERTDSNITCTQSSANYCMSTETVSSSSISILHDNNDVTNNRTFYRLDNNVSVVFDKITNFGDTPIDIITQNHTAAYLDNTATPYTYVVNSNNSIDITQSFGPEIFVGGQAVIDNINVGLKLFFVSNQNYSININDRLPFFKNAYHIAIRPYYQNIIGEVKHCSIFDAFNDSEGPKLQLIESSVSSKSLVFSNSDNLNYIYIGTESNSEILFPSANIRVLTDSDHFIYETDQNNLPCKLVLTNGSNLKISVVNQTYQTVFSSSESDNYIIEWNNDSVEIVCSSNSEPERKVVIIKNNVEAVNVSMKFMNKYDEEEQAFIHNLAFDSTKILINYSYDDLLTSNFVNDDLVLYKGTYDSIDSFNSLTLGYDNLRFTDNINIPQGSILAIEPNSNIIFDTSCGINVKGTLFINGDLYNEVIIDNHRDTWSGIHISSTGEATISYAQLSHSNIAIMNEGKAHISNSNFNNNNVGIINDKCNEFYINRSNFTSNMTTGILVKDISLALNKSTIKSSSFDYNGYGIWVYNSSPLIQSCSVNHSKYASIYSSRLSYPVIEKCTLLNSINYTGVSSLDTPEIKLSGQSYPVMDYLCNEIIPGNGYSVYISDNDPKDFYCRDNWWGSSNQHNIGNTFYPTSWNVIFSPFLTDPVNLSTSNTSLKQAIVYEKEGQFSQAKQIYNQLISDCSGEADISLARLYNISENSSDIYSVLTILENDYINTNDNICFTESFKAYCARKDGNTQLAVHILDQLLEHPDLSQLDSLYIELDKYYISLQDDSRLSALDYNTMIMNNSILKTIQDIELLDCEDNNDSNNIINEVYHYPNPVSRLSMLKLSLNFKSETTFNIGIYNIKGQKIISLKDNKATKGNSIYEFSNKNSPLPIIPNGVYFLSVDTPSDRYLSKILILRGKQ